MEIIFIRTIVLFSISVAMLRLMGRRQLGELEPYEVVITIMIAEVAMTPMDDPRAPVLYGVIPIVTLYILHTAISYLSLKLIWFRSLICGKEVLIIDKGCLLIDNMRKNDYSMDELMEQLREKSIFNIDEVAFAMIEAGGSLSVMKKPEYMFVKRHDLGIKTGDGHLPQTIITCGKQEKNCTVDMDSFMATAKAYGFYGLEKIFYASLSSTDKLFIQGYDGKSVIADWSENNAS